MCFRDLDGDDCNASLTIVETQAQDTITNTGYWSDLGNSLGVWVNPQVCTLPLKEQSVTYTIPIETTDTYTFQVGCDDTMQIFLFDEQDPFMDVVGGIFRSGTYSTPQTAQRTLQGGTNLIMTVNCTNSAAGFINSEGFPYGKAYSWDRNPGGWFVQICRGACATPTKGFVLDGHTAYSFIKSPQVAQGLEETQGILLPVAQTATWNVTVPTTGIYTLKTAADNTAVFTLDGATLLTQTGFITADETTTSVTLTSGNHTIGVTATNIQNSAGATPEWPSNPAGVAWTLSSDSENSNVDVVFDQFGNLVTTGGGSATVVFLGSMMIIQTRMVRQRTL